MPKLSWSEVRDRAVKFSREWADAKSERADKQTFWNEFFEVFGIPRKSVASFEAPVRKRTGSSGAIDLFWRGRLLVEHKSRGQDLTAAQGQAFDYIQDLTAEGRLDEIPRYVLVSDFEKVSLFDLEADGGAHAPLLFTLADFHRHTRAFAFMLGQEPVRTDPQDPANDRAYKLMCDLHDELKAGGFGGPELERLLVRILFCLFAEDTGIFAPNAFTSFLLDTREDGSDLGAQLNHFFYILDMPEKSRGRLAEELAALPYVNGQLFKERLGYPAFTAPMRLALIECARFYWARISPAVFGSLFQGVMDDEERRRKGAHYTSERDILRLIRSLFLDDLRAEFVQLSADRSTRRIANLEAFHERLRKLRFLDPACGCGNFLVLAYRELRALEIDLIRALTDDGKQLVIELRTLLRVDVDQFCGIEIEEWPARIAEVALWLMDHQMNVLASEAFGKYVERLPLVSAPKIVIGNALRMSWDDVLPRGDASYVLGNPPFIGKQFRGAEQQADVERVWTGVKGNGVLDYVTCWYRLAADYVREQKSRAAFVSTNSISQGEQVGVLWTELYRLGMTIQFAHRTFPWASEARGKAHVHVVIVGFGSQRDAPRRIYDYEVSGANAGAQGSVANVTNISPYLVQGPDLAVLKRSKPLCNVPEMSYGNMPNDGGHLLLSDDERNDLVRAYPDAEKFIRAYVGPDEFLYSTKRWCLWLVGASPKELRAVPPIEDRVRAVQETRRKSPRPTTNALASTPTLFGEIRQPTSNYLGVPKTTSGERRYIPFGFFAPEVIASTDLLTVDAATLYEFGVLSSTMHMAWVRTIGGRLKSDPRYSSSLVYNSFPWPEGVTDAQRAGVVKAAEAVLTARAPFLPPAGSSNLADIYDATLMPPALVQAHEQLDRVVELCYRRAAAPTADGSAARTIQPFKNDWERVEFLLAMYARLVAPLLAPTKAKKRRQK